MKKSILTFLTAFSFLFISCIETNPNEQSNQMMDNQQVNTVGSIKIRDSILSHTAYVPIYSDIYNKNRGERILLTATLSIRNTSITDTLFLNNVDYYDTAGAKVRGYLDEPIYLKPLESLDYVIEESDKSGGTGANFIINWYSHEEMTPLFQAIMIGGLGHRAFSFTTDGIQVN